MRLLKVRLPNLRLPAMRPPSMRPIALALPAVRLPRARAGRALIGLWTVMLLAAATLAGVLQWLGPPPRAPLKPPPGHGRTVAVAQVSQLSATQPGAPLPPRQTPAGTAAPPRHDIAPPDRALLEPAPQDPGAMLPRRAADGREARRLYAAPAPALPEGTPRIAILLDGVGLSGADSLDAIASLPAAVSLAVSPYAIAPGTVLDAARSTGHELLLSLPMEPAGAPLDDEGAEAMSEHVTPEENLRRLDWSLSRIQGYAGVTDATAGLDGERFAASSQFADVARRLAGRGLFYLDAMPDQPVPGAIAAVRADLRLDAEPDAAFDAQLATLERLAIGRGSAVAVAGPVFPLTVRRLAEWARGLRAHGLVLVPVSSLAREAARTPAGPPSQDPSGGTR